MLLCAAIATLMSIVLIQQWRSHGGQVRGLGWWSAAPLTVFLGSLLLAGRNILPTTLSVVGGNMLILTGMSCFLLGTEIFLSIAKSRWIWVMIIVAGVLLFIFSIIQPDYRIRLCIFSSCLIILMATQFRAIVQYGNLSFACMFLLVSAGFAIVTGFIRIATVYLESGAGDLFAPSIYQNIYLASYSVILLAQSVGIMLFGQERLRSLIAHSANHDFLTGAFTRRAFCERGAAIVASHRSSGQPLSVLMFDIDHFKTINDNFGHIVGDAVLQDFGLRCLGILRKDDLFGRYGGEEFVILLPNSNEREAVETASLIRSTAAGINIPTVTVSVGISVLTSRDESVDATHSLWSLIGRADDALYLAKKGGRDSIRVAGAGSRELRVGSATIVS